MYISCVQYPPKRSAQSKSSHAHILEIHLYIRTIIQENISGGMCALYMRTDCLYL